MEICSKCGNLIDLKNDYSFGKHCKKCNQQSGAFIECIFCKNLDLLKKPPCSREFIIVKDGKCQNFIKIISINDIIALMKKYPHLFDLVN
ncbi:MAG: hypothetical protein ACFFCM_10930 [Promethearchaeota archaeon]